MSARDRHAPWFREPGARYLAALEAADANQFEPHCIRRFHTWFAFDGRTVVRVAEVAAIPSTPIPPMELP